MKDGGRGAAGLVEMEFLWLGLGFIVFLLFLKLPPLLCVLKTSIYRQKYC